MSTTGAVEREPFTLHPDREARLWQLVTRLGVNPMAGALALTGEVLRHRAEALDPEAFGAAAELAYQLRQGRPVQFLQRPPAGGELT